MINLNRFTNRMALPLFFEKIGIHLKGYNSSKYNIIVSCNIAGEQSFKGLRGKINSRFNDYFLDLHCDLCNSLGEWIDDESIDGYKIEIENGTGDPVIDEQLIGLKPKLLTELVRHYYSPTNSFDFFRNSYVKMNSPQDYVASIIQDVSDIYDALYLELRTQLDIISNLNLFAMAIKRYCYGSELISILGRSVYFEYNRLKVDKDFIYSEVCELNKRVVGHWLRSTTERNILELELLESDAYKVFINESGWFHLHEVVYEKYRTFYLELISKAKRDVEGLKESTPLPVNYDVLNNAANPILYEVSQSRHSKGSVNSEQLGKLSYFDWKGNFEREKGQVEAMFRVLKKEYLRETRVISFKSIFSPSHTVVIDWQGDVDDLLRLFAGLFVLNRINQFCILKRICTVFTVNGVKLNPQDSMLSKKFDNYKNEARNNFNCLGKSISNALCHVKPFVGNEKNNLKKKPLKPLL
jgi:hypothetical protein